MSRKAEIADLDTGELTLARPRATLVEVAADKLRELILLEKLPAGAQISERDLASALGISRTPLTRALTILEQDGLIEYSVTRRPQVANPPFEEIAQNLVVMGALEALAGELACTRITDAEIARVAGYQQQMEAGEGTLSPLESFQLDMQMHEAIVAASGNAPLIDTHRKYNARLWRARFQSSQRRAGRDQTLAEHRAIIAALSQRDPVATAIALRRHLASAVTNIRNVFQDAGTARSPNPDTETPA
ncbi:MAG: GntR family transcriptional regulator [Marinovum algicola]|uniref:Transcriptional regulator, GntR family n=1 Tax=Marinovum algicola TaxID=42444 RepID=A0A975ZP03_9RHOB|nr:GntR family transcriptional regulator [Marinovum algicola]SEJ72522.1 transcriptional regulator, GntR family [Marinovum algicola]SLN57470.1 putative HTH-type transcriptional regulator YdfH [Marinovum algicola]